VSPLTLCDLVSHDVAEAEEEGQRDYHADDHGHETGRSVRTTRCTERLFDSVDDVEVGVITGHHPRPGPG